MTRTTLQAAWIWGLVAGLAATAGCASPSKSTSKRAELFEGQRSRSKRTQTRNKEKKETTRTQTAWGGEIEFSLPDPPTSLSRTIDASFKDWDSSSFREFAGAEHVVKGERFWDGNDDTSVRVAAHSDPGHFYLAVEVTDDTVIDAASASPFSDGVVLWLRDPGLAELRNELPESYMDNRQLQPELAILFTPDGQFWRHDDEDGGLYRKGIEASTTKTDEGYRVEIALTIGVLQQVSALPLEELAFRVEAIDGDNRKRRGKQTHISTLPSEGGSPKYALYDLDSWIPYEPLTGQPPREDVLGRWRLAEEGWTFDAFEIVPENWRLLSETESMERQLRDQNAYGDLCDTASRKARLVEAYQARNGNRVALVVCGTRPDGGTCPADAKSHLYWAKLGARGERWQIRRSKRVTREPMKQCPSSAAGERPLHTSFSLYPLTMYNAPVWAIGWHKRRRSERERFSRSGVWFVNTARDNPRIETIQTAETQAGPRSRELSRTHLYLTKVDRKRGPDICAIETVRKQDCEGLDEGCRTRKRGVGRYAHIRMWDGDKGAFERYLMSKHRRCRARFDFSSRQAYLLFHRNKRLGLIRSDK